MKIIKSKEGKLAIDGCFDSFLLPSNLSDVAIESNIDCIVIATRFHIVKPWNKTPLSSFIIGEIKYLYLFEKDHIVYMLNVSNNSIAEFEPNFIQRIADTYNNAIYSTK